MNYSPQEFHGILQARILEWVAIPISRESYQPRDQTQVSYTAARFFTIWATRKNRNSLISYFVTVSPKWDPPPSTGGGAPSDRGVCVCARMLSQSCPTLWPHGLQLARILCQWDFPGRNIGVGCHVLLQGVLLTQGSTQVSCIGRRDIYCWATWEVPLPGVARASRMCSRGHCFLWKPSTVLLNVIPVNWGSGVFS